jgi:hypothetical protein
MQIKYISKNNKNAPTGILFQQGKKPNNNHATNKQRTSKITKCSNRTGYYSS